MIFAIYAILLLAGLAVGYVIWPLLRPERFSADEAMTAAEQRAQARQTIYQVIRELDLDFGAGKLAEADYRQQREQLEQRALAMLRSDDQEEAALAAEIEREVAARRASAGRSGAKGGRADAERKRASQRARGESLRQCARCHQAVRPGDKFCARCGGAIG